MARKKKSKTTTTTTTPGPSTDTDEKVTEQTYKNYESISKVLSEAWKSREFADAKIIAGEDEDMKTFPVNSVILSWRSEYFRSVFYGGYSESAEKILRKPNIRPEVMDLILGYVYSGEITLTADSELSLEVLAGADEMTLKELATFVGQHIAASIDSDGALDYLRNAYQQNIQALKDTCLEAVLIRFGDIFDSNVDDILTLPEEALVDLLSNDRLALSEEDVFKLVTLYGMKKANITATTPEALTVEQFAEIKPHVAHLIPLIRIGLIDVQTLALTVEKSGWFGDSDLAKRYKFEVVPSSIDTSTNAAYRVREASLKLIKGSETQMVNKWIGGGNKKWKLLFQASRDGWLASTFHSKCDKKGPTVVVVTDGKSRCGGYTPLDWEGGRNAYHAGQGGSFVFSLENPDKTAPLQFKCSNTTYELYQANSQGPTFGGGFDLMITDNAHLNQVSYSNLGHSYSGTGASNTHMFGKQNYQPTDYAVYSVQ